MTAMMATPATASAIRRPLRRPGPDLAADSGGGSGGLSGLRNRRRLGRDLRWRLGPGSRPHAGRELGQRRGSDARGLVGFRIRSRCAAQPSRGGGIRRQQDVLGPDGRAARAPIEGDLERHELFEVGYHLRAERYREARSVGRHGKGAEGRLGGLPAVGPEVPVVVGAPHGHAPGTGRGALRKDQESMSAERMRGIGLDFELHGPFPQAAVSQPRARRGSCRDAGSAPRPR